MIEPSQVDRVTRFAAHLVWDVLLLLVVFTSFMALGLAHAKAGGWSTWSGGVLGLMWLGLFFSPVVDGVLDRATRARRSPWFDAVAGVLRVGRAIVALGALLAGVLLWLAGGTLSGILDLLRQLLKVVGLQ